MSSPTTLTTKRHQQGVAGCLAADASDVLSKSPQEVLRRLDRRSFLELAFGTVAMSAFVACSKSPTAPESGVAGLVGSSATSIRVYSGSTLTEDGEAISLIGLLELNSARTTADVVVLLGGVRYIGGRITATPANGGWNHTISDSTGTVVADYLAPTNELITGLPENSQLAVVPAAAVLTAMATGAIIGLVSNLIQYSVMNFRSWTLNGAINAAWVGAVWGAALGPFGSKAETFVKPVVSRAVQAIGNSKNYAAALKVAMRFLSDMVAAIRRLF